MSAKRRKIEEETLAGDQVILEGELEAYPMRLLTASLTALQRQGEIEFEDIDLLSRMADAMICKVALLLAEAKNPKKLRERSLKITNSLLGALRK